MSVNILKRDIPSFKDLNRFTDKASAKDLAALAEDQWKDIAQRTSLLFKPFKYIYHKIKPLKTVHKLELTLDRYLLAMNQTAVLTKETLDAIHDGTVDTDGYTKGVGKRLLDYYYWGLVRYYAQKSGSDVDSVKESLSHLPWDELYGNFMHEIETRKETLNLTNLTITRRSIVADEIRQGLALRFWKGVAHPDDPKYLHGPATYIQEAAALGNKTSLENLTAYAVYQVASINNVCKYYLAVLDRDTTFNYQRFLNAPQEEINRLKPLTRRGSFQKPEKINLAEVINVGLATIKQQQKQRAQIVAHLNQRRGLPPKDLENDAFFAQRAQEDWHAYHGQPLPTIAALPEDAPIEENLATMLENHAANDHYTVLTFTPDAFLQERHRHSFKDRVRDAQDLPSSPSSDQGTEPLLSHRQSDDHTTELDTSSAE